MSASETQIMPVLFLGHGSPMNAIEDNAFRRSWQALGQRLPKPRAILCVSAHWETRGVYLTATPTPETIHDFYGFPKALFDVQYPVPGDPELAREIADLLAPQHVHLDLGRGLDHGVWGVIEPMYPAAGIPVLQLSLDMDEPGDFHYALGQKLAPLRRAGVLIVASGNIVHNLRVFSFRDPTPYDWAIGFDELVRAKIAARSHAELCDYARLDAHASQAVPTPEHYLPVLYALALQEPGENLKLFNTEVQSSLSMTSFIIGEG